MNQTQPVSPSQGRPTQPVGKPPMIRPWVLALLVVVIIAAVIYWWFTRNNSAGTTNVTISPTASATVKPSASPTASPSPSTTSSLTYNNSTYGFTLTFPTTWQGYKFKQANIAGATVTYYVEVPTTDKSFAGDSSEDAGYYAPFAISVYTLAQWDTLQQQEGPKDTLIIKNATYAFGWSQANGIPASDFGTKSNDIKTIIDSFKLK